MSDTRELKTIDLPSGLKAKVVTFYTRGEIKAIKKARWTGTEISVDEDDETTRGRGKINPVSEDCLDDEIVFQGTKILVDGEVENSIKRDLMDKLHIDDFDTCLRRLKPLFLGKGKKKSSKKKSSTPRTS